MAAKGMDTLTTAVQNPSQLAGQAEGVAKGATSEVKSAASAIKNKLKIPF